MGSAVKAARCYLAWNGGRLPTTDDLLRYFTSSAKFEDEHRERKLGDALWDVSARISERALHGPQGDPARPGQRGGWGGPL